MKISDYLDKTLKVVVDLTGIEAEDVMGRRRTSELVDARWMVVKLLREAGYYPSQIAPVMNMTIRQVQSIVAAFDIRLRFADEMMRINYETASKYLRSN